nr:hypothetical protein [Tanacetum cinerariifolium]
CFNYHKTGHFARECRAQRNQDGRFKNQDNNRKQGNNKDTSSKAMLSIDGVGFYWSDMAEEQVQTNMALMTFSDSKENNDKACTKTCLKNYETLKKRCDGLIVKLNQTKFAAATYKRGLETVEEQLVTYKRMSEFKKVKQEKEGIEFKIEKFDNASKSLDKLRGSQITENSKKGLGYHVVPPPHHLIHNGPTKLDLSYSGRDEFKESEFKGCGPRDSKQESNTIHDQKSDDSKENSDDSFVKEQVSKDTSSFVESPLNEFDEGYVTFGEGAHDGRISGKDLLTKGFDAGRFKYLVSSSGPKCQDTILGDVEAQTRFEAASKQFNDPPLPRVNTLGGREDNIKLKELKEFCTKLSE